MLSSKAKGIVGSKGFSLVVITVILMAFFQIMNSNYLSVNNLKGMMNACSLTGTITVGMACLLMSGSIDLSSGSIGCMGGVAVSMLLLTGMPWPVALVLTLIIGMLCGALNAFLCNVLGFMPFIATIGTQSVIRSVATIITNSQSIAISDKGFWALGGNYLWIFPLPFVFMIVLMVIYGLLISQTRFGRRMLLCGGNRNAARLAGINAKKLTTIMFLNNGAVAAFAGAIYTARMHSSAPTNIVGAEMNGMTAAIIGGVSFFGGGASSMGTLFIALAMITSFQIGLITINLDSYWQIVSNGMLLIVALIVDFYREKRRVQSLRAGA
jgi:ribose transport system permease protein